jgi:D-alanyl-D-alanine carboxypeptidase (penicillin-binding protein 5/6)
MNIMKSKIITFLLIVCATPAFAEYKTKAKSAFLLDYDSGAEIVSKSADELMPPSSMLKLMTLAVLFDGVKSGQISLDDRFPVGKNADYQDPVWYPASKICLSAGQDISVRDLILGLIVLSGGDASVVVAEKLAGTEEKFTDMMTAKARAIGMPLSTFGNASGLPNDRNLMTSRELATLAYHIISDYPDLYPMFATRRFEFGEYKTDWCRDWGKTHTVNYNKLLFIMPGADGLKTGHTDKGGYGMVASATAGGRRLIGVINGFHGKGHDALAAEMKSLLTHGFNTTTTKVFYRPGDDVTAVPVWYGRNGTVMGTVDRTFAITTPKESSLNGVRVLARYTDPMPAPIHAGDVLGEVIAERDGNVVARTNLIAKNNVGRVRFFARVWRNIVVMLTGR